LSRQSARLVCASRRSRTSALRTIRGRIKDVRNGTSPPAGARQPPPLARPEFSFDVRRYVVYRTDRRRRLAYRYVCEEPLVWNLH
jgi:hypothetical protein